MKNLPNQLTVSRVVLIFVFVLLSALDNTNEYCIRVSAETARICHIIALAIAIIAALTDLLDGYLARKFKAESDFGRLIDPLADKIFVMATFTVLVSYHLIPGWFLVVILAREFMVTGLRTLASAKGIVIAADRWGKVKTALQMVMLGIGGLAWVEFLPMDNKVILVSWWILLTVVAVITVASGLGYFIKYKKLYLESI